MKIKVTAIMFFLLISTACSTGGSDKYKLHKFYKDPLSLAAILMGGTYAGILEKFDTIEECMVSKQQSENNDKEIGYTNSSFRCSKNSEKHYMEMRPLRNS